MITVNPALLAAAQAMGIALAPQFGPVAAAAINAASSLLSAAMASQASGVDMTHEQFDAAVKRDDAAIADNLVARAEVAGRK